MGSFAGLVERRAAGIDRPSRKFRNTALRSAGIPERGELNSANSGILAGFTPFLATSYRPADISRDPTGCFTWDASPLGSGVYKDKINTVILLVVVVTEIDSCLLCDCV